jgi:hypothetical protein
MTCGRPIVIIGSFGFADFAAIGKAARSTAYRLFSPAFFGHLVFPACGNTIARYSTRCLNAPQARVAFFLCNAIGTITIV